ncbi:MAG: DASS family sodium-coupled anion symporter [Gemmatimonadetes bacterium]|nr:DASS family sodium-coupled anion symporter [Gemmatimonadota bacterium]
MQVEGESARTGTVDVGADTQGGFQWPADRPEDRGTPRRPGPRRVSPLRWWLSVVGCGAGVLIAVLPTPAGLVPAGKASIAVFVIAISLWITQVVPIGVTGLLAVALLATIGGLAPSEAYAAFGNPAVFFILGVFIIASALIHSGLSKRLALLFLRRFEGGAFRLAAGIMFAGALMTVFMPNQASAAMLFPITLEIARAAGLRPGESPYGRVLFFALAWGAMIGANASILGSARVPLALELYEQRFASTLTFLQWLIATAPLVVAGTLIGLAVLRVTYRSDGVDLRAAQRTIEEGVTRLGRMGSVQWRVAAVMVLTIGAWIFLAGTLDRAAIAVIGAASLFALGVLRWNDLEGYVQWGIVLMYGGAIAIGVAIDRSGAAGWLVVGLIDRVTLSPAIIMIGLGVLAVALSEIMSNAAAVAVLLPLAFSLTGTFDLSPAVLVLTTCAGAGMAYTLPISSAPNTIAYSSGYVGMRDMAMIGSLMTVAQLLLLVAVQTFYWPYLGFLN